MENRKKRKIEYLFIITGEISSTLEHSLDEFLRKTVMELLPGLANSNYPIKVTLDKKKKKL